MINREFVKKWCESFKKYWYEKDIKKVCELFSKTEYYQETPFMKPFDNLNEIENEWQYIKNERIEEIKINILAIEDNVAIVNWYLKQNNDVYDGIYEIKFNDSKECIYFKSWEMQKSE
jgi:hypothetical protein